MILNLTNIPNKAITDNSLSCAAFRLLCRAISIENGEIEDSDLAKSIGITDDEFKTCIKELIRSGYVIDLNGDGSEYMITC